MIVLTREGFKSELDALEESITLEVKVVLAAIVCHLKHGVGFPPALESSIPLVKKHLTNGFLLDNTLYDVVLYKPQTSKCSMPVFIPVIRFKPEEITRLDEIR